MPDLFTFFISAGTVAEHLGAIAAVIGGIAWAAVALHELRQGVGAIKGIEQKLTSIEARLTLLGDASAVVDADHEQRLAEHDRRLDEHSAVLDTLQ